MEDDKKPDAQKRQVGERVKLNLNITKDTTTDLGDGIFEAIITTSGTDRHNENIVTSGIDTKRYLDNPVVLYGHDYFGLPIGKTLKLTEMKNKIKAKFQLAYEEYDFAQTVGAMIKGGYLNAVSIGGIVKKWSDDWKTIEEMEMLEFSIVSIPANGEAMITARSFEEATGKSLEKVQAEYEEFAHGDMLDKLKHMGNDDISSAIKVLESLTATLKESYDATSSVGEAEPEAVKRIKRIRLMDTAKSVNKESERVIRLIKLK